MSTNTATSRYVEASSGSGRPLRFKRDRTPDKHPSDVFVDLIQKSPEYCNNCFSRRFSFHGLDFHCGELGWLKWERRYPVPKRNDPDPHRQLRHDGGPLCCSTCGHHNGQDRSLSANEVTAHAGRLSRALDNEGIAHDRETLLREARRRAYEPDTSGAEDMRVFSPAVAESIRVV